jgi:hypothetical protein
MCVTEHYNDTNKDFKIGFVAAGVSAKNFLSKATISSTNDVE